MKKKGKTIKKVVQFAQSKSKSKQFRHDYPISDDVKHILLEDVYGDFTKYVLEQNFTAISTVLKGYIDDHHPKEEKREALAHNLFWWKILYESVQDPAMSCIEDYIAGNYFELIHNPLITSWLREWEKAIPKFYYVGYKYNDRVLVVMDLLTKETLDVIVYDPLAVPPEKGEIVMGTLIPLGDALYFPVIDFYHFDFEARKELAVHIPYYYDKYLKTSTMHEAFIHVLSAALQIERLVFMENQKKIPSN